MKTVVAIRTEVIHRFVFELRYEFGQVYWDRAGKIAREIASQEGWEIEAIDMNRCRLIHRDDNLGFSFGPDKLDLVQTQSADVPNLLSIGEFGALAESLADVVVRVLELPFFPRIGFRVWRLYPSADRGESQTQSRNLKLFQVDADLGSTLGGISDTSHRLVTERPNHMLRIAVAPFEQTVNIPDSVVAAARTRARDHWKAQKQVLLDQLKADKIVKSFPRFGLLLDLDTYIEDPPFPDDLSISDFIARSNEDSEVIKKAVLAESD